MAISDISPNVDNYFVGAGIVKIKLPTDIAYVDAGNVSKFEYTTTATRLKHYSARTGIRRKDKDVVTQMDATVAMTMDEFNARNLAFALLGSDPGGAAPIIINLGDTPDIIAAVRLVGTNDIGAKVQVDLPSVLIAPSGAIGLINAGTWGEIALVGEINADITTGLFGRLAWGITGEIAYP